jgi:hypothetical protein
MRITMKKIILILVAITGIQFHVVAQSRLNGGIGYFGEYLSHPGFVLELEYEKMHREDFALPLRGDLGYHSTPDYHAFTIDIHKGFRKYFASGFVVEQSAGVGAIAKNYTGNFWYSDQYSNSIPHGNTTVWGFMPSLTAGLGYNFSKDKEGADLLWIRPKLYWDLGFRGLHLPYWALQIGFSHTFKIK